MKIDTRTALRVCALTVSATLTAHATAAPQWLAEPELLADDAGANHDFGRGAALDGDRLLVGAPGGGPPGLSRAGAAYVFERTPGWTQTRKLVASDAVANAHLGIAVALDGVLAVCGAWTDQGLGAVYVFDASSGAERGKIVPSDLGTNDRFGESVAVSGAFIVAGAPQQDGGGGLDRGAAYVYDVSSAPWTLLGKLIGSDSLPRDAFGCAVAISGNRIVVGARAHDGATNNEGAAYVFQAGNEIQKLVPSDASVTDSFGRSVAVDGDTILVCSKDAGYVFTRQGTTWVEQQRLAPGGWPDDANGGITGALDGDRIVLGVPETDTAKGAVAVFVRSGTTWSEVAYRTAPDAENADRMGASVAISGANAVAGAFDGSAPGAAESGSVYPFTFDANPSFCDGAMLHFCPCGNQGTLDTGCDNAQGSGGVKAEFTEIDRANALSTLVATGFPTTQTPPAVVIRSSALESTPQVFFDGVRCIGLAGFVRMAGTLAVNGTSVHEVGHLIAPGTYHYQVWYRSNPDTFCTPAASNVSNGATLTW